MVRVQVAAERSVALALANVDMRRRHCGDGNSSSSSSKVLVCSSCGFFLHAGSWSLAASGSWLAFFFGGRRGGPSGMAGCHCTASSSRSRDSRVILLLFLLPRTSLRLCFLLCFLSNFCFGWLLEPCSSIGSSSEQFRGWLRVREREKHTHTHTHKYNSLVEFQLAANEFRLYFQLAGCSPTLHSRSKLRAMWRLLRIAISSYYCREWEAYEAWRLFWINLLIKTLRDAAK